MNEKDFIVIYEKYFDDVYRFAFSFVRNKYHANEIVSNVWFKILKHFKENKEINKSFIFLVVRTTSIDFIRHETIRVQEDISELEIEDKENHNIQDDFDTKKTVTYLLEIIDTLPDSQREIIRLRFFSELQNKEIAKILDISEKNVSSTITKALQKLRVYINSDKKLSSILFEK